VLTLTLTPERARPVFKKLNLQVRLFPVERAAERPWRAVATCPLDALTGTMNFYPHPSGRRKRNPTDPKAGAGGGGCPTLRRSVERAAQNWVIEFRLGFAAVAGERAVARAGEAATGLAGKRHGHRFHSRTGGLPEWTREVPGEVPAAGAGYAA